MVNKIECPPGWSPGCCCNPLGTEPFEGCDLHGFPDPRICPYCGQFRKYNEACKRCGCSYGIVEEGL